MTTKKRKEIAQEVKQLGAEGQDVVQQVTNLENLAELAISTFEDQSEGVTAEAIQSTSKANIRFQSTVEKKVDQKTQEGEEIYDELSVKQENFEQAIVADKADISKLNTLKEQASSEKINSSEIDKAKESKQEEIEFLQGQSQIVQENQKGLKSKILNSKRRRQAAQSSYHSKNSLYSSQQDLKTKNEKLFDTYDSSYDGSTDVEKTDGTYQEEKEDTFSFVPNQFNEISDSPVQLQRLTKYQWKQSPNDTVEHILVGDADGGQLTGGLHTQKALDNFTQEYGYTYTVLRTDPTTGVTEIELPISAMRPNPNGSIPANRKTLFPPNWSDDYILSVIEHIAETEPIQLDLYNRQFIEGVFNNVKIKIAIRNGEIVTAFPKL
ncbi:EndoU domain-containing protein [Coleofasciculus sp. FACHB-SPT9]|uniref:EndoU domain-containing protein n=1 Tax=Cyanophyceae TaxID=3028117 RepID=UPI001686A457|nr:EndoU domain-containing protein [Coleofasciculus sp. FACHB-SPT9]MBD1892960.1 EndoU domain-containing protein [Coleofasciculus sp. FACHB-SPT9]